MRIIPSLRLSSEHLAAFKELSGDLNPLHTDSDYANRSEFGQIVNYGMSAVLLGLGEWAQGRPFSIHKIRAEFKKPFFLDQTFTLQISEPQAGQVILKYHSGSVLLSKVTFSFLSISAEDYPDASKEKTSTEANSVSLADLKQVSQREYLKPTAYQPNWAAMKAGLTRFKLARGQIPKNEIKYLLWASYFIGMEYPGRQALFSRLEIETLAELPEKIKLDYHPEFKLIEITLAESEKTKLKLEAFLRPLPIEVGLEELRTKIDLTNRFRDKTVFISGGTRGLGASLAKAFALQGANVIASYRSNQKQAEAFAKELAVLPIKVRTFRGDLSSPDQALALRQEIATHFKEIDFIVNNASPIISPQSFLEQTAAEYSNFVSHSLNIYANTCRELLPLLPDGGSVISISSIFSIQPEPLYSHYLTAKAAIEALTSALCLETPRLNFFILRPPRMLTDQTNQVTNLNPMVSTTKVLSKFFRDFDQLKNVPGLKEWNYE